MLIPATRWFWTDLTARDVYKRQDQSRAKALEKERKKLNKRLAELDRLFSSLYEDCLLYTSRCV